MSQGQQLLQKSLEVTVIYSNSNGQSVYTIYGFLEGKQVFLGNCLNVAHPLQVVMTTNAPTKVKFITSKPAICPSGKRRR